MAKLLGTLPSDLKESNRRRILDAFYKKKVLSALEIAADTGISRQTVKKCIDYFLSVGVLEKCVQDRSCPTSFQNSEQRRPA